MLKDFAQKYTLLLASASPRRSELIRELGLPFRVVESGHGEENYPEGLEGGDIAAYLAEFKSMAYPGELTEGEILLTADTVVWHRGRELAKPAGRDEALEMLRLLSGDAHQVFTGVCLRSAAKRRSFYSETEVHFAALAEEEIVYYVDRYEPYDKAGAYGIQEWIGLVAVNNMVGSYFNVMGLPVQRVYSELKEFIK